MTVKSTTERYGALALAIHWITAVAIIVVLITGFRADDMTDAVTKTPVLRAHAIGGLTVLALTVIRIVWWLAFDRARPDRDAATPLWQHRAAKSVHGLLLLLMLGLGMSGIYMIVSTGAGETLFGAGTTLPDFWKVAVRGPHGAGGFLVLLLFVLHVLAAFYHQFIMRDAIFARMGIGRR